MLRKHKICFLSKFQLYDTVLLTVVILLSISSPGPNGNSVQSSHFPYAQSSATRKDVWYLLSCFWLISLSIMFLWVIYIATKDRIFLLKGHTILQYMYMCVNVYTCVYIWHMCVYTYHRGFFCCLLLFVYVS